MPQLSFSEMLLRIVLAFCAGFVVGWERERRGRPAGLRTNILACVAAAVAMIVSEALAASASGNGSGTMRLDPARLGAGVLTGIGFLGGGTILRHENLVRGVTTAASLWFVTVLGLAFGSGLFVVGALGLGAALVVLLLLPRFERTVASDEYATLTVTASLEALKEDELRKRVEALGPMVRMIKLRYDLEQRQKTFACELKLKEGEMFQVSSKAVAEFTQCPGVVRVEWA